ncbi:Uncharacterised protein [Vibrio cholerae]|nr:Uncharacterised protein [Vibrio cholerae]
MFLVGHIGDGDNDFIVQALAVAAQIEAQVMRLFWITE